MRALLVLAIAAASVAASTLAIALTSAPALAQARVEPPMRDAAPSQLAVVVLTGDASGNAALSDVISELLLRQGVEPQVQSQARFSPEAFLDSSPADARSYAFVSVHGTDRAKLYFRGPNGARFLLRELSLRDGLDELGRELIARVVETSLVALLHATEGVTQAEARAELAKESALGPPQPAPVPSRVSPPVSNVPPRAATPADLAAVFTLRALTHASGRELGPRFAAGFEGGGRFSMPHWPKLGARLGIEVAIPQHIDAEEADAAVLTIPLRAGLELGTAFELYFALSAGVDVVSLDPERIGDADLALNDASIDLVPVVRAEVRYELPLDAGFALTLAALADVALETTRYDVIQSGSRKTLAAPWAVQPGLAVGLGFRP